MREVANDTSLHDSLREAVSRNAISLRRGVDRRDISKDARLLEEGSESGQLLPANLEIARVVERIVAHVAKSYLLLQVQLVG